LVEDAGKNMQGGFIFRSVATQLLLIFQYPVSALNH